MQVIDNISLQNIENELQFFLLLGVLEIHTVTKKYFFVSLLLFPFLIL